MRVDNSTGKGTSGMDKFSSKVHKVHMELGGKCKLLYSLRIKTSSLKGFRVCVVDGAAHTQKDDVESDGGSLENVAKQGALLILDLDEVDVDLSLPLPPSLSLPPSASS